MIQDGGQRFATTAGAMLADPDAEFNVEESLFEPSFWAARGELIDVTRGRGSAWFIGASPRQWALRHYRRGGVIARFAHDRYLWTGEARVRAFAEWRLLAVLTRRALPVPQPIAARYERHGMLYRCDLITRRIPGALPLSERLARSALREDVWRDIGVALRRLHAAGVDHADLNAHNILIDNADAVSVIDFDRGRLCAPGSPAAPAAWAAGNIARLRRSLEKIAGELPAARYGEREWGWLGDGYAGSPST